MSNRETHAIVGALAGGGFAAYRAHEQEQLQLDAILETIGGAIGGYIGGRLPDVIEPASVPDHRGLAHSVTTGGAVLYIDYKIFGQWEQWFRSEAERYRIEREQRVLAGPEELAYSLMETVLRIAAGALTGFVVGYLSHLMLDANTPRGLPLLK